MNKNKLIQDIKETLAFAVGIGNSLIMLYIFIKILFLDYVIVAEPSIIILTIEIILSIFGMKFLWDIFHKIKYQENENLRKL